jgi:hypothetical protein
VNVEYAVALLVLVAVTTWAMVRAAPLGPIANPLSSPNPAKAAWYFLGLQELLLHMHPLAALGLVGVMVAALVVIPLLDRDEQDIGIYFRSAVGRRAAIWGAALALNLTPILVVLDEYVIDLPGWLPSISADVTTGWVPFLAILLFIGLLYAGLRRSPVYAEQRANHSEALLGVFAFAVTALLVLTIIGIFFRGPNMGLVLPF